MEFLEVLLLIGYFKLPRTYPLLLVKVNFLQLCVMIKVESLSTQLNTMLSTIFRLTEDIL